ncbi:MAG TPA: Dabb family protein [Bauldia sp.]|nr:Dabb family protein [Bauldia sp.]
MIRHTVAFRLKHPQGSAAEAAFIADGRRILTAIPGVTRFEALRQDSPRNGFAFGFSMEFADQAAYDGYNDHPDHVAFVRDRWLKEVDDFLEADFQPA